ncbi:YceI family protein [Parvularcula lutaonensis]|uniref:YceI family protein n=1 Tax=Parvularcula lutaonensis TaxID=491923 RepID=A0ABV7MC60_9PROT|nr:YceI family protein [Parvularcula lutaonensis]GGY39224.1 polyisoprenoid-binding protein [Parvularcula lutaonensis]
MKLLTTSLIAAASLVSIAQAQDVPSGEYKLDPAHTTVIWGVNHAGFSLYRGSFDSVDGTLIWDAENPTKSRLSVSIDANSVDSPEAVSHDGNANFQEDIAKNALGAETQPVITFTSKRLERTGDTTGVIYGDLSFNGNTGPVEMQVSLTGSGDFMGTPKLGFSGETTIDRTKWGSNAWTQFGIGTDVTISIQSEFAKAD